MKFEGFFMAKLLIVDDDQEIRNLCKSWFEPRHRVELCGSVQEALAFLGAGGYDAIILDLGLPDGDGSTVVEKCRAQTRDTPIIVLSGRDSVESKVDLIDIGADDYLTKPFHFKELESRVNALLRRPFGIRSDVLSSGDISLNLSSARLTRSGEEIECTPKELALIEFFLRYPDQVFSRDAIMQRVWTNDSDASPEIVKVYITRLRKKLEKDGDPPLITNQRGHGYIFRSPDSQ